LDRGSNLLPLKTVIMIVPLIEGTFEKGDAIELINQLFATKIKFHENKISTSLNEEDIKMRETKIKRLQQGMADARKEIAAHGQKINLHSEINLS